MFFQFKLAFVFLRAYVRADAVNSCLFLCKCSFFCFSICVCVAISRVSVVVSFFYFLLITVKFSCISLYGRVGWVGRGISMLSMRVYFCVQMCADAMNVLGLMKLFLYSVIITYD